MAAAFVEEIRYPEPIVCRFVQGLILCPNRCWSSYAYLFVSRRRAGARLLMMAFISWPWPSGDRLVWPSDHSKPGYGVRMFTIAGVGSSIVWYLRKNLPYLPRWLESQGRTDEAEILMQSIEKESACGGTLPPVVVPASWRRSPPPTCSSRRCCNACSWVHGC